MARVTQLGYLGLGVSDIDGWETFAEEVLGLQSAGRDSNGTLFLRMDEYHHRFALHPSSEDDIAYVGWEVADRSAFDELAARLEREGVAVEMASAEDAAARHVDRLFRFVDPNGVASEIFYGPIVLPQEPFRSPRNISGFLAGDQGLGHCVLAVDDLEASLRFYRDVLGFRVSDFIRLPVTPELTVNLCFLHCNARHHSLAIAAVPPSPKRMNHFMLQATSLDDVGSTYYLCQEREIPIVMSLGRHSNDKMVSFYASTPSGFAVEYGWGAREVDDANWEVQVYTVGSTWGHRVGG